MTARVVKKLQPRSNHPGVAAWVFTDFLLRCSSTFAGRRQLAEEHLLQCYVWCVETSVRDISRCELVGWMLASSSTAWWNKPISQYV